MSDSLAWPPASATRSARDGYRRTTIIRWPITTSLRSPSTNPRQAAAPGAARISAGRAVAAARQQEGKGDDEHAGEPQPVRRAMHTRPGQGTEDREGVCRTCPPTRSLRRCRCRARAAQTGRRGSAARSSEFAATPPTTAIVSCPSCFAAASTRSTSARTIARWYDAARSATPLECSLAEVTHAVEQRRLHARRTRSRARRAGRPGTRMLPRRPPARAGRSRRRPDSRGRADGRPCRTPRPPHRRSRSPSTR